MTGSLSSESSILSVRRFGRNSSFFCASRVSTGQLAEVHHLAIRGPGLARILGLIARRGQLGLEMKHDRPLRDTLRQILRFHNVFKRLVIRRRGCIVAAMVAVLSARCL
jgi:hypothetical protein